MANRKRNPIDRQIINILFPVMIENILITLAGMVLTGYIGHLTVSDISAYGLANRIYNIYYSVFRGLAIGVMVVSAKAYGKNDIARCRKLQETGYCTIVPLALIISLVIILFPKLFIGLMTDDPVLLETASRLLRLTACGFPFIATVALNSAAFQARGNTRTPMFTAFFGNLINITIGYALVFGIGSLSGLGLTGAGISQIITQVFMCSMGLYLIYGRNGLYRFNGGAKKLPRIERQDAKELFSTGVPAALENSFWQVSTVILSSIILSYGQNSYAAYQVGLQAEGLCDIVATSFVTASTSMAAIAIGQNDDHLYQTYYHHLIKQCLIFSVIAIMILAFGSPVLVRLLTDKTELIPIALNYLYTIVWCHLAQNLSKVFFGYIRASHHEKAPMIINFVGIWLIRLPLVYLFSKVLKLEITWIWWAFNIDQWCELIISFIYLKKHRVMYYLSDRAAANQLPH